MPSRKYSRSRSRESEILNEEREEIASRLLSFATPVCEERDETERRVKLSAHAASTHAYAPWHCWIRWVRRGRTPPSREYLHARTSLVHAITKHPSRSVEQHASPQPRCPSRVAIVFTNTITRASSISIKCIDVSRQPFYYQHAPTCADRDARASEKGCHQSEK